MIRTSRILAAMGALAEGFALGVVSTMVLGGLVTAGIVWAAATECEDDEGDA